ncbi:methionine ABC transporter ATP-binding protein [Citricoccus muralis]|uniref:ATP-binding cassette domain-containing protein n=1 Tax=Citricoccus muralis TaxID=169134 RepID=A0ABY8H8N5_9MICC|nr:ATP-binding cassette domain-containing protein [Citricoccus muralis]WFP17023.1 ATP-binding cassette domain-containing protein [Citricoccus muralis]
MISLRHVTTTFKGGDITAVDDVSLDVRRGSIHGIIGFSGAGKSTLLRNINLLERPTSGEVWVDGEELTGLSAEQLRQRRHQIGMIFQGFNLVNNHTAVANVELSLTFAGVTNRRERRRRALEALELVDLADRAKAYPAQLSGGQKQRVAIARALATKPNVLLCDEPTSALDPFTTATVLQYLADINAQLGITIVVVTHEMEVIKALADDVTVMESGAIVEQFTTEQLRSDSFRPHTAIGSYLISEGISVDKGRTGTLEVPATLATHEDVDAASVTADDAATTLQKVGN